MQVGRVEKVTLLVFTTLMAIRLLNMLTMLTVIVQSSAQQIPLLQMLTPSDIEVITSTPKRVSISSTHVTTLLNGEDLFPPTIQLSLILKLPMA